jgi:cell division protein FtsB
VTRARWLAVAVLVLAALFAWQGGVFSTRDYLALKRQVRASHDRLDRLQHQVDSLRAYRDSLRDDPAVQDRVAREQWGMVHPGELIFRLVPPGQTGLDSL